MKKSLMARQKYLWIPISKEKDIKEVKISVGEELMWVFQVSIDMATIETVYKNDYYTEINIEKYAGKVITIEGEVPKAFLNAVMQDDEPPKETEEPACVHFSAKSGWINDPNGLYYQNGIYHLYFQYNPFNTIWENMSWGHAISTDMLHWTQLDSVLYPDRDGTVYSGCAVLNERGLLNLPKDIPLFFYTCAGGRNSWSIGKKFTQKLAYSLDGGNTLIRMDGVLVDHIVDENRDPKVYWHEELEKYYMILYLTGYDYAIFNSEDLQHWEMTQKFTLNQCWECPDLRKVPDGKGGRWVFWCADGFYCTCDFDGKQITKMSEVKSAYKTTLPYAAQTFYGVEDRVIILPWMRTGNKNCSYTGMMGLPRELEIVNQNGVEVLVQRPIREYYANRKEVGLPIICEENTAVEVELDLGTSEKAYVDVFGTVYGYDGETGICIAGTKEVMLEKNLHQLSFLIDKELVEISALEYTLYAAVETESLKQQGTIFVKSADEGTKITAYLSR